MIGKLKGIIDTIESDHVIVDVSGVGYLVLCSPRTLRAVGGMGEAISLIIETHVREDNISLFGFIDSIERDWFRELINVKGVGSKLAFSILGALSPDKLSLAVVSKDKQAFKNISGVGPKLAERIMIELKDKTPSAPMVFNNSSAAKEASPKTIDGPRHDLIINDAISALVNLGYNRTDAYTVISKLVNQHGDISLNELIRLSLREFVR
jgi:Holliday junction DNA helicase RuvA